MAHNIAPTNWAGNIAYGTSIVHQPTTVEEVQDIVKKSSKLKALGTRHSFNQIADSTENLISLSAFDKVISLDTSAHTVTVQGGVKYGDVAPYLHQNGYALHNLASLPHISVAGACATATHGSGPRNGNLATAVAAVEFVDANGNLVHLSKEKDAELFDAAVVNLGALGIVTSITLALQPAFDVEQLVYRNLPMEELEKNFSSIMDSGYSVSLFTTWKNKTINQVWMKRLSTGSNQVTNSEFFGAKLAEANMHPLEELSAEHATEQGGVAGPWYDRLPHFKMGFQPSAGKELQTEYFVAAAHAFEAMMAIEKLHEQISPYLFVSEIRAIAADTLWMSPAYKQDCVGFHFTWKQDWGRVSKLLPIIEDTLAPYHAVPHWGKLFTMAPSVLQPRLPKLHDFRQVVQEYDPQGKFINKFLAAYLHA